MIWKSNARFGQEPKEGTIFDLKGSKVKISIHNFSGCGDKLYLSCYELNISKASLDTEDFDEAVKKAKEIIKNRVDFLKEETGKFLAEENENEFTRY